MDQPKQFKMNLKVWKYELA